MVKSMSFGTTMVSLIRVFKIMFFFQFQSDQRYKKIWLKNDFSKCEIKNFEWYFDVCLTEDCLKIKLNG